MAAAPTKPSDVTPPGASACRAATTLAPRCGLGDAARISVKVSALVRSVAGLGDVDAVDPHPGVEEQPCRLLAEAAGRAGDHDLVGQRDGPVDHSFSPRRVDGVARLVAGDSPLIACRRACRSVCGTSRRWAACRICGHACGSEAELGERRGCAEVGRELAHSGHRVVAVQRSGDGGQRERASPPCGLESVSQQDRGDVTGVDATGCRDGVVDAVRVREATSRSGCGDQADEVRAVEGSRPPDEAARMQHGVVRTFREVADGQAGGQLAERVAVARAERESGAGDRGEC